MDKGFELVSFINNEVKLESKHKEMIIKIYNYSAHVIIKHKEGRSDSRHYDWNYAGQNLIPRKYQDMVNKYVIAFKLL